MDPGTWGSSWRGQFAGTSLEAHQHRASLWSAPTGPVLVLQRELTGLHRQQAVWPDEAAVQQQQLKVMLRSSALDTLSSASSGRGEVAAGR